MVEIEPVQSSHQAKQSKIHVVNLFVNPIPSGDAGQGARYDSFFNCDGQQSKCKYLRPGQFFDHYYSSYIKNEQSTNEQLMQWRNEIGLENANLPALTSLSWRSNISGSNTSSSNERLIEHRIDEYLFFPRNLTYIHVHKCGGTSIQTALARRASHVKNLQFDITLGKNHGQNDTKLVEMLSNVHHYKHSYGGGSTRKKEMWDQQRIDHIHSIYNASIDNITTFPAFTIIRDPIDRFLSAVQQVMHYNAEFRAKCLKEPSNPADEPSAAAARKQLIQCAIDDMHQTNYRRDVHLLPMAAHFRLFNRNTGGFGQDIPVSVFYMDDFEEVLEVVSGESEIQSTTVHARDRTDKDYATSHTLSKLCIDDCSNEMKQQLCRLFHVDYALLKWLGFGEGATKKCIGDKRLRHNRVT